MEIGSWLEEKLQSHPFPEDSSDLDTAIAGRLGPRRTVFDATDDGSILVSKDKLTLQSQNAFSTVKANCCVYSGRWMYEVWLPVNSRWIVFRGEAVNYDMGFIDFMLK